MSPQQRALRALTGASRYAPTAAAVERDPFAAVLFDHVLLERFCDLLEAMADALPDQMDRQAAEAAARFLEDVYPANLAVENELFLPALLAAAVGDRALCWALHQARIEHDVDEEHGRELADLLACAGNGDLRRPDALGYMLRGFFEGQRRHVSWEQTVLFPLARAALSKARLGRLADEVARSAAWQQVQDGMLQPGA